MYKVDYAVEYSVQANPTTTGGTVTVVPASPDGFYANGAAVDLTATPSAGYCFAGWSGLVAGAPSETSLTANKPYNLVANFQTGAVSLPFGSFALPKKGGTITLSISANSGCLWKVAASQPWLTINSAMSGSGPGTLSFTLPMNTTGVSRTGTITVGNYTMLLTQGGR
jgi:hypothetical protein